MRDAKKEHTRGPWHISRDGQTVFASTDGAGVLISGVEQVVPHIAYLARNGFAATLAEQQANARLISAAPSLLAALKSILSAVAVTGALSGELGSDIQAAAYAAVAKAEGKQEAAHVENH